MRIENPLSALYRGMEYFSLARTFRTAWGGNCILDMKNRQKNTAEATGNRYEIEILVSRTQKLKGLVAAFAQIENINDSP